MPFSSAQLNLVGPTAENRSHQANNELTKNWYPQIVPNGVAPAVLLPWLGSSLFGSDSNTGLDRGTHEFDGVLYRVLDQTLYSIDKNGVHTSIGTIDGTNRCVFSNSVVGTIRQMVIAATELYIYDGTDLTKSTRQATSATYLNSKTIYPIAGGFTFSVSGAGGADTVTGGIGSAESSTDNLLRPYAFNQWVYMMKEKVIEPFYDTGATTGVPLSRIDNAIMQKGLGGFYTVANTDQAMYFLGDDSNVYQVIQSQLKSISPPWVVNSIKDLDKTTAEGDTITFNGQDFYVLKFSSGMSWAYMESIGEWFNLSSDTDDNPYLASSYIRVYDKDLAVDSRTGKMIELSPTVYGDLGETIQRRRVLPPFSSKDLGIGSGKRLTMSKVVFTLQTGQGIASGQGSIPKIMVEYSLDGGETWSTERWLDVGRMGKYLLKVEYWEAVRFYEITFRITISDPVFSSLHSASIDVKAGGY